MKNIYSIDHIVFGPYCLTMVQSLLCRKESIVLCFLMSRNTNASLSSSVAVVEDCFDL